MKKYRVEIDERGTTFWYKLGTRLLHKEAGPAVIWDDGGKEYYMNGELHRENGPALDCANGHKEYWIHGVELTKAEFLAVQDEPNIGKLVEIDGNQYKLMAV